MTSCVCSVWNVITHTQFELVVSHKLSWTVCLPSLCGVGVNIIPNSNPLKWSKEHCRVRYRIVRCAVLYCTVLYCTVLYCTVLYCTVLYCTVLYGTVLYCTYCSSITLAEWYGTVLTVPLSLSLSGTIRYGTVLYRTYCSSVTLAE